MSKAQVTSTPTLLIIVVDDGIDVDVNNGEDPYGGYGGGDVMMMMLTTMTTFPYISLICDQ